MQTVRTNLTRVLLALLPVCFGVVFLAAVLRGNLPFRYFPIGAALAVGFKLFASKLLPQLDRLSERNYRLVLCGGLLLLLVLMMASGFALLNDNTSAPFDTEAVYRTALDIARGNIHPLYNDYFVGCDSNALCMFCLAGVYSLVNLLGGTLSPAVGMVFNALLLWLAPVFLCKAARLLWGRRGGVLALSLSLLFLPYYLFVPFLYTDPMTAPLVSLCLYLALRLEKGWQADSTKKRFVLLAALALALPLAFLMKGSALLLYIALPLYFLCRHGLPRPKVLLPLVAAFLAISVAVIGGFRLWERQCGLLDFAGYDAYHMPTTHWIMMGLENDGAYNNTSFAYTGASPTLAEKSAAVDIRLQSNLSTLLHNPAALAWLMATKSETCWTDGLYSAPMMAALAPVARTAWSEWALPDGQYQALTNGFGQCFYYMLWLLAMAAALRRVRRPGGSTLLLPALCLLGNLAFFSLWEANSRYTFCFSGCLLLLACAGCLDTDHEKTS